MPTFTQTRDAHADVYRISRIRAHAVLGVSEQGPPEVSIGDYSTDANGHCYFYGERLDSGKRARVSVMCLRVLRVGGVIFPARSNSVLK